MNSTMSHVLRRKKKIHVTIRRSHAAHDQLPSRSWNDLASPHSLGSLALSLVVEVASVDWDVLVLLTSRRHD